VAGTGNLFDPKGHATHAAVATMLKLKKKASYRRIETTIGGFCVSGRKEAVKNGK